MSTHRYANQKRDLLEELGRYGSLTFFEAVLPHFKGYSDEDSVRNYKKTPISTWLLSFDGPDELAFHFHIVLFFRFFAHVAPGLV